MLVERTSARATKECWKTRISYIEGDDAISIEHFSEAGKLLSEAIMDIEDAMDYIRDINIVIDKALGVE